MVGPSVPSAPMFRTRSLWMASAAEMVRVPPSSAVVAPDLMPFLPLAVTVRLPVPHRVTWEPSLHLMTAFSAASLSGDSSSLFLALSVRLLTEPSAATMVTWVDLLQVMGAVSALVRAKPFSTSVTPVAPFFTVMEPSAQVPVTA